MASIELNDVSLHFRVRQKRKVTLKEYLIHHLYSKSLNPYVEVRALDGIDLRLRDGDRIGIIVHNGAGARMVDGRISSLFDITLGFEMESTGWENINYRSFLMGETPKSIAPRKQEI